MTKRIDTTDVEEPKAKRTDERELSPEELDQVSGGKATSTASSHTTHNSSSNKP